MRIGEVIASFIHGVALPHPVGPPQRPSGELLVP